MSKRMTGNHYTKHPSGDRIHESYMNENGIECINVPWDNGEVMTIKLGAPGDPFWNDACRAIESVARNERLQKSPTVQSRKKRTARNDTSKHRSVRLKEDRMAKSTSRKKEPAAKPKEEPEGHFYIDENGVECYATTWEDGRPIVLKILNVNDPFWEECRKDLADLPYLDLDQTISDLTAR